MGLDMRITKDTGTTGQCCSHHRYIAGPVLFATKLFCIEGSFMGECCCEGSIAREDFGGCTKLSNFSTVEENIRSESWSPRRWSIQG